MTDEINEVQEPAVDAAAQPEATAAETTLTTATRVSPSI